MQRSQRQADARQDNGATRAAPLNTHSAFAAAVASSGGNSAAQDELAQSGESGDVLTRGEATEVLGGLLGLANSTAGDAAFSDVPDAHASAGAIYGARDASMVGGFPDGTFQPDVPLREDHARILIERAQKGGGAPEVQSQGSGAAPKSQAAPVQSGPAGVLGEGSSGAAVTQLQILLTAAGHPIARTGRFGPTTKEKVLAFQAANGVQQTGRVGPTTTDILEQKSSLDAAIQHGLVIEQGMRGQLVRELQERLEHEPVTGVYDDATVAAVRALQADSNIQQNGMVGPTTMKALGVGSLKGVSGEDYDAALGSALARASSGEAAGRWSAGGRCYFHVANAVDQVVGRFLTGKHAYMAASQFAARPHLFTEISPGSLGGLPAGAVVVWGKGSSDSGHISVAQGDGYETSDFIGRQMESHYGGAPARVFLPKARMGR